MKIAIVGPVHPYKGGIAQHTTALAHHLKAAGHTVTIISWKSQYPFFYPGVQFVPEDKPELPVFKDSRRVLSWKNPIGWWQWARKLKKYDEVIFAWWVPTIQGPVYWTMLRALGRHGPHLLVLCHNIIQHGAGAKDKFLTRLVFDRADELLVHTKDLANIASDVTATPIAIASIPAHLPGQSTKQKPHATVQKHLLFFGLVRQYKGVDVLVQALAEVPDVTLTIAGEMWGKQQAKLEQLIEQLELGKRVTLLPGYVPAESIAGLFAKCDALVLPYRAATATQNTAMAFNQGVPVIATRVGSMPQQIRDGTDGLLCKPNDSASLAAAIHRFYEAGVAKKLAANLPASTAENDWKHYVSTIIAHAGKN